MAPPRRWPRGSRRLSILLLTVVLPPAATLGWLGWRFIQQDTELVDRRAVERREAAARLIGRALGLSLAEAESHAVTDSPVPEGMTRLRASASGVHADPVELLWAVVPDPGPAAADDVYRAAEQLEYGGRDAAAVRRYTDLARSPDPAIRAGALIRLARVHRRASRWEDALAAYRRLATIGDASIDGAPADLQARRAMADVFDAAGRTAARDEVAGALEADLITGRWASRIDSALWRRTIADLERWTGRSLQVSADRARASSVAEAIWRDRERSRDGADADGGWRLLTIAGDTLTVFSDASGARHLVLSPAVLDRWVRDASGDWTDAAVHLTLTAPSGNRMAGHAMAGDTSADPRADAVRLAPAESGLPWVLVVAPLDPPMVGAEGDARRRLLAVGVAAILLLFGGSSYFLWRLVRREMAVARLQSEFVAAVSHEFRTPLTSLRHVSELLAESDDVPADERRSFYGTLGRSTQRLQRLVESLLDFSRLEAGRTPYDLQPIDASAFVRDVVAEFRREPAADRTRIDVTCDDDAPWIRADRASLGQAMWNLLDNAAKYAGDSRVVTVSIARVGADIAMAVRDEGIGIPADEQAHVFQRFVRGRQALQLGIGGTGLGLAIVAHVVAAHGGQLTVASTEGRGSTFTIALPAMPIGAVVEPRGATLLGAERRQRMGVGPQPH
jgi:signal transduction histidine kinase